MGRDDTRNRVQRIAGILIFLPATALALSAFAKFAGVPDVLHKMAAYGFSGGKLMLVAALEITGAALFLYRRTRSFGRLFLSSFLGGAICVHVQSDEYAKAAGPCILLILAWLGAWLHRPLVNSQNGTTKINPVTAGRLESA